MNKYYKTTFIILFNFKFFQIMTNKNALFILKLNLISIQNNELDQHADFINNFHEQQLMKIQNNFKFPY